MEKQKTIAREISCQGAGLHTAKKVHMTMKPAQDDSGITFIRVDKPGMPSIKVSVDTVLSVTRSPRRTTLSVGEGVQIQTIEHCMSAFAGLGIDNITIELDNDELPVLDGSSMSFVELCTKAGLREQEKLKKVFVVKEPLFVEEEGASIVVLPAKNFKISYTLHYPHPQLKAQFLELEITPEIFQKELAPARTFCLEEEAEELQRQGFGQGATFENTLVIGAKGIVKNTLRFEDEFIRHKILDLLGDLYLLGAPIRGHVIALRSGHSLNLKIARKIYEQSKRGLSAGIAGGNFSLEDEQLEVTTIMKILPHREPFLFVDRIIHLQQGKHATGIKNVTINDYFFRGHFPGRPVMPGVLIVEALAQVGGVMMLVPEENRGKLAFFLAANNIKFRKTVVPGDQLVLDVVAGKIKSKTGQVHGKAYVDGKVVAEADLMFALVE
ncbi:MAG: bifunctional UDP-3-O-[3-hydroxymyristoyl] N-acetylglucosamine deacetylase/3-hydroxyacyl-ACP dehydratase [Candidatus Omnitrophica bacterium]|nr:bifunctional UDP-3-O-[3-hydroxymyristoyl] N-acetylglucosamine deacetylase/3-hydroxyacyl-ACP dehydratase [Candidatus Omnitrophota bacterium]